MIDVWKKIYYSPEGDQGIGSTAEVTLDSMQHKSILLGYHHSTSKFIVYENEIDGLIEALQELRECLK